MRDNSQADRATFAQISMVISGRKTLQIGRKKFRYLKTG